MSRNQRIALLGLAVVVLVVGFVIAKSGSDNNDDSTADTTSIPSSVRQSLGMRIHTWRSSPEGCGPVLPILTGRESRFSSSISMG